MMDAMKMLQNGPDVALLLMQLFVFITCLSMAGGALWSQADRFRIAAATGQPELSPYRPEGLRTRAVALGFGKRKRNAPKRAGDRSSKS